MVLPGCTTLSQYTKQKRKVRRTSGLHMVRKHRTFSLIKLHISRLNRMISSLNYNYQEWLDIGGDECRECCSNGKIEEVHVPFRNISPVTTGIIGM